MTKVKGCLVLPLLPARCQHYLPLVFSPLSVEIPSFLPVTFLSGAKTSLPAAPGSPHAQDLPGGPVAPGPVSAAPAKRLAPFSAAQLRGCSLLGVQFGPAVPFCADVPSLPVPSSLTLSVAHLLPGHVSPVPNLPVSLSSQLCALPCARFGAFPLPILVRTNSRVTRKSKIWGLGYFVAHGANTLHRSQI